MFVKYARPLIGDNWVSVLMIDGRLRLAQLDTRRCSPAKTQFYIPQADRK
ncbi:MAG: hypothetical protein R3C01_13095 [Planctomycetaceae bacterium]